MRTATSKLRHSGVWIVHKSEVFGTQSKVEGLADAVSCIELHPVLYCLGKSRRLGRRSHDLMFLPESRKTQLLCDREAGDS